MPPAELPNDPVEPRYNICPAATFMLEEIIAWSVNAVPDGLHDVVLNFVPATPDPDATEYTSTVVPESPLDIGSQVME